MSVSARMSDAAQLSPVGSTSKKSPRETDAKTPTTPLTTRDNVILEIPETPSFYDYGSSPTEDLESSEKQRVIDTTLATMTTGIIPEFPESPSLYKDARIDDSLIDETKSRVESRGGLELPFAKPGDVIKDIPLNESTMVEHSHLAQLEFSHEQRMMKAENKGLQQENDHIPMDGRPAGDTKDPILDREDNAANTFQDAHKQHDVSGTGKNVNIQQIDIEPTTAMIANQNLPNESMQSDMAERSSIFNNDFSLTESAVGALASNVSTDQASERVLGATLTPEPIPGPEATPALEPASLPEQQPENLTPTPDQLRLHAAQTRHVTATATLSELEEKRAALLREFAGHLSPHVLESTPSAWPTGETYQPSTLAHTAPSPSPFTPEDGEKITAEAKKVIQDHITRLHTYNEIRDVGQGLIGIIADQRGVRIVDCQEEFGVSTGD